MKKWCAIGLLLVLLMQLTGCFGMQQGMTNDDTHKGGTDMEQLTLTEEEIEILTKVYGEEERFRQGTLFAHQQQALEQLRCGMQYLEEKYPGHTLTVLTFSPATKLTQSAQCLLSDADMKTYTLTISVEQDGYVCADTYYGAYLQAPYDAYIGELLSEDGVRSITFFDSPLGKQAGKALSVEAFIAIEPKVMRNSHLFVPLTGDQQALRERIQAVLCEHGVYGSYILYFVPREQFGDVDTMEAARDQWDSMSFHCFDVG